MNSPERLAVGRIESVIESSRFWQLLVYAERVDSTNDVAKRLASDGSPEGTIVVAEEQTAGRGRMERRWIAPQGSSILSSILFRPELSLGETRRLTMLCSMAAADAVRRVSGLRSAIKWPNDLIIPSDPAGDATQGWRKLAGILTEAATIGEDVDFAVVGIGVNVNVSLEALPALAPQATSIQAEIGQRIDRSELLIELLDDVERRYERLRSGQNPRAEWSERLTTLGQQVRATTTQGTLRGLAEAVDEDGALLLRTGDGELHRLVTGDVTLSPP